MNKSVKNVVENAEKVAFLETYINSTKAHKRLGVLREPIKNVVKWYINEYPQITRLEQKLPRLKARFLTTERLTEEDVSAGWQTTYLLTKDGTPCESYSIAIEANNGNDLTLSKTERNKILDKTKIEELLELESQELWVNSLSKKGKKYYGKQPYGLSESQQQILDDVLADNLDKMSSADYAKLLKKVFLDRKNEKNKHNEREQMLYKMDREKTLCHEVAHFLSSAKQQLYAADGCELPMYFFGLKDSFDGCVIESYGGVEFSVFPLSKSGEFVLDSTGQVVSEQVSPINYYLHEAMTEFITMKMVDKINFNYNGEKLHFTDEVKETLLSYRLYELCVEMFDAINNGEFEESYFGGKPVELGNLNENFYQTFDNLFDNVDNLENNYAEFCEDSSAYNKLCLYDNFRKALFETRTQFSKNMADVADLYNGGIITEKQLNAYLIAQNKFISPFQWAAHVCYGDELLYDMERAINGMAREYLKDFKAKNSLSTIENVTKICKKTKKYLPNNNKEKLQTIFSIKDKDINRKNEEISKPKIVEQTK